MKNNQKSDSPPATVLFISHSYGPLSGALTSRWKFLHWSYGGADGLGVKGNTDLLLLPSQGEGVQNTRTGWPRRRGGPCEEKGSERSRELSIKNTEQYVTVLVRPKNSTHENTIFQYFYCR